MVEYQLDYPFVIMITGGIIILTMLIKSGFERTGVPPLVGYLFLGFLVRLADDGWGFMSPGCREIVGFLAKLGLVTLLFRVGLESNLKRLLSQLRRGQPGLDRRRTSKRYRGFSGRLFSSESGMDHKSDRRYRVYRHQRRDIRGDLG